MSVFELAQESSAYAFGHRIETSLNCLNDDVLDIISKFVSGEAIRHWHSCGNPLRLMLSSLNREYKKQYQKLVYVDWETDGVETRLLSEKYNHREEKVHVYYMHRITFVRPPEYSYNRLTRAPIPRGANTMFVWKPEDPSLFKPLLRLPTSTEEGAHVDGMASYVATVRGRSIYQRVRLLDIMKVYMIKYVEIHLPVNETTTRGYLYVDEKNNLDMFPALQNPDENVTQMWPEAIQKTYVDKGIYVFSPKSVTIRFETGQQPTNACVKMREMLTQRMQLWNMSLCLEKCPLQGELHLLKGFLHIAKPSTKTVARLYLDGDAPRTVSQREVELEVYHVGLPSGPSPFTGAVHMDYSYKVKKLYLDRVPSCVVRMVHSTGCDIEISVTGPEDLTETYKWIRLDMRNHLEKIPEVFRSSIERGFVPRNCGSNDAGSDVLVDHLLGYCVCLAGGKATMQRFATMAKIELPEFTKATKKRKRDPDVISVGS